MYVYYPVVELHSDHLLKTLHHPEISFSAKIEKLEAENSNLVGVVGMWQKRAMVESERRQLAENEMSMLRTYNQELQQKAQDSELNAENFRNRFLRCARCLNKIIPLLEDLRAETRLEY